MDNVKLVHQLYQSFSTGDVATVLAAFDPAIDWSECPGMPFVSGDGNFVGPQAVVGNVFAQLPQHFDGFHIVVDEIFGSGDRVVMVGAYHGTAKATGKAFQARAVHIWTAKNGKMTRFVQAADTATIMKP